MQVIVPALAALISLLFAAAVFGQFLERRRPHHAAWTVGLLAWALGTGAEAVIGAAGLHALPYRLWYLGGAIFTAAWLGLGSLYLQLGRQSRAGHIVAGLLATASLAAAVLTLTAPLDLSRAYADSRLVGAAFPLVVRLLTPFFNVFGTVLLVGVALWSVVRYAHQRHDGRYVLSNLLIAGGALLPALGGSLSRLGIPEFLWLSELFGVLIMFLGFLRSQGAIRIQSIRHSSAAAGGTSNV
jgi:hypothetical protein